MKTKEPNEVIERLSKQYGDWVSDMIPDKYRNNPFAIDLIERLFELPKEELKKFSMILDIIRDTYFKPADGIHAVTNAALDTTQGGLINMSDEDHDDANRGKP